MPQPRDFMVPGRSPALSDKGMVSTSNAMATLAGVEVLKEGGNAVDAAIAAVALQCVIEPHMTGIGGDCFVLYMPSGDEPIALNGSGRAPSAISLDRLAEIGVGAIDDRSAHSVTIPGCVDAWCRLAHDHGRLPMERTLRPAIEAARNGFLVSQRTASDWQLYAARLDENAAVTYLPGGEAPRFGHRFALPALANTLEQIARRGRDAFYMGEVAEELVTLLSRVGGFHTGEDFAGACADYIKPIQTDYGGHTLHEAPPNGQGIAALMIAGILERVGYRDISNGEAERIHLLAEATKAVFAQREMLVADPQRSPIDFRDGLDSNFLDQLAGSIDRERASSYPTHQFPRHRDTVQICVVDDEGNAVSLINSICAAFGSGIFAPGCGVLLQNRGVGFSLDPSHPNRLEGGKRPFHTIIPGLLSQSGRAVMPFGVIGLQYQAVGHVQVMSGVVDRDLDVQQACDAPRSFAFDGELSLEPTIAADVPARLAAKGHRVTIAEHPIGGCQAIWIDHERGILAGAADQRRDGIALGI